jgi:tetratricopeptide (TPR) repeat protein
MRSMKTGNACPCLPRWPWWPLALALLCLGPGARGNDFATAFDTANQLYVDGRFADAASAYDAMIQTGNLSEAILFNRGNALFREGKTGLAIASYREAQLLAPRDPDLRANLQFARTRARGGSPYHVNHWRNWLDRLTLNEWTALVVAALWAFFLLLAAGQWRKELRAALAGYVVAAGLAAAFLGVCLGMELQTNFFARSAIVTIGEADIRNGPFDEAPSLFKVRDGIELDVLDHKDNWLQVADSAQRIGWVRRDQVVLFQPAALANGKG